MSSYYMTAMRRLLGIQYMPGIRKGIWNFTEAVLSIQDEPESVKAAYKLIAESLIADRFCDVDKAIAENGLEGAAKDTILANFGKLVQQGFLNDADQNPLSASLVNLLAFSFEGLDKINYVQPAFFWARRAAAGRSPPSWRRRSATLWISRIRTSCKASPPPTGV
jgi:hypothetical protein